MAGRTRKTHHLFFAEQGHHLFTAVWALLSMALLLALARSAHADTFSPSQTTFGATAVGATSQPALITLVAQASGTPGAPVAVTEGSTAPALEEFVVADPGTCGSIGSLSAGQSCTLSVAFSPRYPGIRQGAVRLLNSGGQLLASTLISGVGQGSLPLLIPGQVNTVAGDGQWFYQGDGIPATQAPIYLPSGLAVDGSGDLYLADTVNNRVRRVDATTHTITTVAGNGSAGSYGDNGPATSAEITGPSGLALDGAGNLYLADTGNSTIRRVDAVSGSITTVAGTPGVSGYFGDGGPATSAKLDAPQGIAVTPAGDLIIADTSNHVIRLVSAADGSIRTIAGTGTPGFNRDGILATAAQLNEPAGVAIRSDGTIAIADLSNNRVRSMTIGGAISTIAGTGNPGYSGDGSSATSAELQGPTAVAFDPAGDLLIADSVNNCIRLVYGSAQTIVTLSGIPTDDRYAGDGGPENQARMHGPAALSFDASGNIWFADRFNNRIREVNSSLLTIGPYPTMKVGKLSQPVPEAILNAGNQDLVLANPVTVQAALDPATTTCGQAPLDPSGFCSMGVEFSPTSVGPNVQGSITWNSNAPNVAPIDQLYGEVLSVEPTSVTITSSSNPGVLGQPVTLTATVTSADSGRTGTVDFKEGTTTWCRAVALGASGTAACEIPSLSLGTHSFIGSYSGDNNNAASESSEYDEIIKQQPALALGISTSPAVVTSNVTLTLSAADSTGIPSGTVVFYDGATALATVTLDANGGASWSTNAFSIRTHVISAQYSGDGANVAGTSASRTLQVTQASTVTVLSSANNDATVGSNVSLTANVVTNGGPAPSGTVQFLDGKTAIGSAALSSGSASLVTSVLTPGHHSLTAVYSGDNNNATSTSAPIVQMVEQIATVTTLGADVDPASAGALIHFSAIVSLAPGASPDGALAGVVTFSDGGTTLGTAVLNASGQATLAVSNLAVGTHNIVATYDGGTNYAASHSTGLAETVQQTPTALTLSAASSTTLMGRAATFTGQVTSPTGIPTGTITIKDGAATLGTAAVDAHGFVTFSTTQLSAGVHTISAIYSGDANYLAATSAPVQLTVALAQTSLSLGGPNTAVDAGTDATFAGVLSSPGVQPTGTLKLLDGGVVLATLPVTAVGGFSFITSQLTVGNHQIEVRYSGDVNNAPSSSVVLVITVQQAPTSVILTPSTNPITVGNNVSLTAAVTSGSPNPGNGIQFYDGSTLLGTAPLDANGQARIEVSGFTVGLHTLTAVYSGDVNHAGSRSPSLPELVVQSSSLAVTSSTNPSVSGQTVTFTAWINGTPTPTGSVQFSDSGRLLATVPLDLTGRASFSTASLAVGQHGIQIIYTGDTHFATVQAQITQAVLHATTSVTLSSESNPAVYGTPLTLSAVVSSNGGNPTGEVRLMDGSQAIGSAQLDSGGRVTFTSSSLLPGSHTIIASYIGDGKASASTSEPFVLVVKQVTSLSLSSDNNPAQTLSSVVLRVKVNSPGAAQASGPVTFAEGSTILGTSILDDNGTASIAVPEMTAGTHSISASYAGDGANFASQSHPLAQVIQLRPTTTTVTGSATDPSNPQQMTLIAVVHGTGTVPPGGLITFSSGNVTLGAAQVDATGVATITVIFASPTQQIVAAYAGDSSYAGSQSAATPITAGQPAQFTLALSTPSITLVSHQRTTVTVTIGSVKGFTDNINLGCLGLPYAATCTFDHSQIKLNANGTVSASLMLDTGDPLGAGTSTAARLAASRNVILCFPPLALLLAGWKAKNQRRRVPFLLAVLCAVVAGSALTGCGGLQMSGTPAGTYTFKVVATGQGSNTTQVQPMTLVVMQ